MCLYMEHHSIYSSVPFIYVYLYLGNSFMSRSVPSHRNTTPYIPSHRIDSDVDDVLSTIVGLLCSYTHIL